MDKAHQVIRASAGAGKTFRLSSRYLKLLDGGAAPSTILATTFTRKAAGEILERIMQRLALAAMDQKSADTLAEQLDDPHLTLSRCRALLQMLARSLHQTAVSTIDGFFSRLARCFALELDLPLEATLVPAEDPRLVQLRRDAIDAMLADENMDAMLDLLRRLHHDQAQRRVTDAIDDIVKNLYELHQQTDAAAWRRLPEAHGLTRAQLAEAVDRLAEAINHNTIRGLSNALNGNYEAVVLRDWSGFMKKGLAPKISAVGENQEVFFGNSKKPVSTQIVDAYCPLIAHARAELLNGVARRTAAMRELLNQFDHHYARLRCEHGLMLFSDPPARLAGGLAISNPDVLLDVYYRMDQRASHLLLDEFQDTSPLQWAVLRPFAQEIRATGDVDYDADVRGAERSFFCVGDMKQAIYGWRGGCAAIFAQVEHDLNLPADAGETMSQSYRSAQPVLDAVNQVFDAIATRPPLEDFADELASWTQSFEPHQAVKTKQLGYVELRTSPAVDDAPTNVRSDDNDDNDDDEGGHDVLSVNPHEQYAANRIAELAAAHPGRSVGVLVQTNKTVNRYLYQLQLRGLPASGEGGNPIVDDPAVNVVLSLLTLADHPGDQVAAFHVLGSPLAPIVGLSSMAPADVLKTSQRIRRDVLSRGYAAVLTGWALRLASSCHARNAVRLSQLIELADQYEPARTLRCRDFVRFVRSARVEEPSSAPIRVMTVHRAKGLEFDLVVLPELHRRMGDVSHQPVWSHRPTETEAPDAVVATCNKEVRALIAASYPIIEQAHQQEKKARLLDDLCALYVAMTRPRHALHMMIPPIKKTKKGEIGAGGWTNLSEATILRRALAPGGDERIEGDQTIYAVGQADWDQRAEGRVKTMAPAQMLSVAVAAKSSDQRRRSWRRVAPSALESEGRVDAGQLLRLSGDQARQTGRVIHKWFEQINWLEDSADVLSDQALLRAALSLDQPPAETSVRQMLGLFRSMLDQSTVRQIFKRPKEGDSRCTLWRERDFAVRQGGRLLRGTFDRVVAYHSVDGSAQRAELIDFKTDRVNEGDGSLAEAIKRYRPQIAAYQRALSTMLNLDAKQIACRLLFVREGVVRTF